MKPKVGDKIKILRANDYRQVGDTYIVVSENLKEYNVCHARSERTQRLAFFNLNDRGTIWELEYVLSLFKKPVDGPALTPHSGFVGSANLPIDLDFDDYER